jgi:hypothetical protein
MRAVCGAWARCAAPDITRVVCTTPIAVAAISFPSTNWARMLLRHAVGVVGTLRRKIAPFSTTQSEGCTQMKRLATLAAVLLALTVASVALGAGGLGKFKTKITGKGANTEHGTLDGTWTIDLSSRTSGKLNLTWNGGAAGGGAYAISGSTITFTPKKNGACATKGKYTFKLTGKTLTFTKISDTCAKRSDVLGARRWTKVG